MKNYLKKLYVEILYRNDSELLDNPFKKSQDFFILQVVVATVFSLLTSGTFLSGFAVYLGASDEMISFFSIMPTICGVFLLFGGIFLEKLHNKKQTVIALIVISRTTLCSIVTIPLFVPEGIRHWAMLAVTVVAFALQAMSGVVVNKWFISVVPDNIRGRYFAVRQSFALAVSIALPLFTGWFMDSVRDKYIGFVVLYSLGLITMAIEVYAYRNIDEPAIDYMGKGKANLADIFRLPIQNKEFLNYVMNISVLYLILYFSCSFTSAYLIKYLKMPYIIINLMGIFSSVIQIFFIRIWGVLGDKHGHKFVMNLSIWFFAGEIFIWAIAPKDYFLYMVPFAFVFSAAANSGFLIGAFNRRYTIIPEKGRIIYDGFYSAIVGISLIIAPLLGGLVKNLIASNEFITGHVEFGQFRILYMMTTVGVILLQLVNMVRNKKSSEICNDATKLHI